MKYSVLIPAFLFSCMAGVAQSPGGVSANLTFWLKANTTIPGNITYNGTNNISNWKSDIGTYSVSQATVSKQPVFFNVPSTSANFNYNPVVQFTQGNLTTLFNTSTSPNLLGTTGNIYISTNKYLPAGGGSMLTYYSNSSYRFQIKSGFRVQNGVSPNGYKFDLGTLPGAIINYPDESAFLLASISTGPNSQCRRNSTDFGPPSSNTPTYFPSISPGLYIGSNGGTAEYTSHSIGEIIMYGVTLTAAERARVESYLAIKYGVTFDELANQFTNYLASDATVVWSKTTNTGYNENIAGIARDDASGLMQKQAKSVNNNALVSIYNGNTNGVFPAMNDNNNAPLSVDKSFFLVGDNNGDTNMISCYNNGYMSRMGRIWKVQKTGTVNAVTLAFDNSFLPKAKKLLVSDNPAFTGASIFTLSNNGLKKYSSLTLNNGQYFTFASDSTLVNLQFQNTPVCPGQNGTVTITNPVNGVVYNWYLVPTGGNPIATGTSCTVNNLAGNTNLYVETVTPFNCVIPNRTLTLAQTANLITLKTNNDTSVCAGQPVPINTVSNGTVFSWTPTTALSNPNIANPVATPLVTTRYTVTATLGGCTKKDSFNIVMLPGPQVDAGPDLSTLAGSPVILQGSGIGVSYLWTPSTGLSSTTIINPTATPSVTTLYRLTIKGSNGCSNSDSMTVLIIAPCIRTVNAFSPNGDGVNDRWVVSTGFACLSKIQTKVYNRYGNKVFESGDYKNDWDGTYNGKPLPDGTYYYVLSYTLINGQMVPMKGDVTILR